jgi:hypothetical protein
MINDIATRIILVLIGIGALISIFIIRDKKTLIRYDISYIINITSPYSNNIYKIIKSLEKLYFKASNNLI